jgi:hypothetical protein
VNPLQDNITIKVDISKNILRQYFIIRSRRLIIAALFIIIITLYNPLYLLMTKPHLVSEYWSKLIITIISIVIVIGVIFLSAFITFKNVNNALYDSQSDKWYEINPTGFAYKTPKKIFSYVWSDVYVIKEYGEFFTIRVREGYFLIPISSFGTTECFNRFRKLINGSVDVNKLRLRDNVL